MASVRASLLTQARSAARRLGDAAGESVASTAVVDQLVRCAQLSQDAERTLEWALHTLRAHASDSADTTACQLLRAARARLDDGPGTDPAAAPTLAWR